MVSVPSSLAIIHRKKKNAKIKASIALVGVSQKRGSRFIISFGELWDFSKKRF
ncbi:MAG: hypothetical protein BWY82_00543 [Verrucomicrobia bacterium ADurb.Bin474]|nr:MAG: hypothetical protein BWY82_00543 [Verrucomicrobia bacterium ADurb.Bin474]